MGYLGELGGGMVGLDWIDIPKGRGARIHARMDG